LNGIILQLSPEHSSRMERRHYQTEILNNLMDHLLAVDVLLSDPAAMSSAMPSSNTSSAYVQLANNVFYLAGRVVDKLWQGMLVCHIKLTSVTLLLKKPGLDPTVSATF